MLAADCCNFGVVFVVIGILYIFYLGCYFILCNIWVLFMFFLSCFVFTLYGSNYDLIDVLPYRNPPSPPCWLLFVLLGAAHREPRAQQFAEPRLESVERLCSIRRRWTRGGRGRSGQRRRHSRRRDTQTGVCDTRTGGDGAGVHTRHRDGRRGIHAADEGSGLRCRHPGRSPGREGQDGFREPGGHVRVASRVSAGLLSVLFLCAINCKFIMISWISSINLYICMEKVSCRWEKGIAKYKFM